MKKRKIKLSLPQIKLRKLPIKLIIFIFVFLVIGFIIGYLGKILKNLDYFKIKDIILSDGRAEEFSYLKGRNILDIDLIRESRYISESYPTYKKVRLIRVLPNRIFIEFIRRSPLAFIKLYRYFCVDEEQVLFDISGRLQGTDSSSLSMQDEDLPVILGLETKIFGPKAGIKYNVKELTLALTIIKELNSNRALRDYKFKTIDVTSPANAAFFLTDGLEVKIGQYDIKNKINILSTLLNQIKNDLNNIKYIDLRFKEPVIKYNNVK